MAISSKGKKILVIGSIGVLVGGFTLYELKGDNVARWYVNKKIGTDKTYTEIMDSVSSLTKMDELLTPVNYEAMDYAYRDARTKGEYDAARYNLALLYDSTIKAAICNYEDIELANLQNFEVWLEADKSDSGKTGLKAKCAIEYEKKVSEQTVGNVINNKIVKVTTSYELKGQLYDMVYNYEMLKNNYPFESKEVSADEAFTLSKTDVVSEKYSDLDSDYLALERFLLSEDVKTALFTKEKLTTDFELKKIRTL